MSLPVKSRAVLKHLGKSARVQKDFASTVIRSFIYKQVEYAIAFKIAL